MKVGVVYPQIELGGSADAVRRIGEAVVGSGFDHLVAYDHVLGAVHADRTPPLTGPYTERDPFHDPFVMFAYLAGRHERPRFATGILILPQRQTVLVARQAADLSLLSGGRFRLGVGTGWNPVEYDALGNDFASRGRRVDEQIALLRDSGPGKWSTSTASTTAWTEPRSFRHRRARPRSGSVAIRHRPTVVPPRLGDGFVFAGGREAIFEQWDHVRALVAAQGRDPATFGGQFLARGTDGPADVAAKIEQWAERGGTHAAVVTMGLGLDSTEAHVDYIGAVGQQLALG